MVDSFSKKERAFAPSRRGAAGRAPSALAFALLLTLLATGLAASARTAQAQSSAAGDFEREVRPIEVRDSTGAPLRFPFLGGLNRPRPQLADIDGDGDLDLFVQERAGRVMFFENEETGAAPLGEERFEERLAFRSAQYRGLDVGQWYRFADMDADGDFDLLAEEPLSYVRYYRNAGTPAAPSFTLATDTLRTTGGAPIFADRRNRPAAFRAGCGERPSLLFGGLDGRLRFFRSTGVGPGGVPQLRLVSERFQGVCAGPPSVCGVGGSGNVPGGGPSSNAGNGLTGGSARHGANALATGDLDGDRDDDVLWGDFFSESFYRIVNRGSCDALRLRLTTDMFPVPDPVQTAGFNAADLADLEADGDADLVFGVLWGSGGGAADAVENLYLLQRTGGGYAERTRRLLTMIDGGGESAPALPDLDADGDADLVVGFEQPRGGATLSYFENRTEEERPSLRQRRVAENPFAALPPVFSAHPAFADLDADGDRDLALGAFGDLALYENIGRPGALQFAPGATFALPALPRANYFAPTFADLDADGDGELVIGTSGGTLLLFRNTGSPATPRFTLESERFGGLDVGARAVPAFRDADADTDLDLYVGARDGLRFYENTGAASQPRFAGTETAASLALPALATPAFADLDADERRDLVAGGESGGLFFFQGQEEMREPPEPTAEPLQAAPNPFHDETTLRFRLDEAAQVRLTLHDARGRRLDVLFEGRVAAGQAVRLPLGAGALASGVYFFRLTTAGGAVLDTGSVVLVR